VGAFLGLRCAKIRLPMHAVLRYPMHVMLVTGTLSYNLVTLSYLARCKEARNVDNSGDIAFW
jgi:hypothetical protein